MKVRVGVIGCGRIAQRFHIKTLLRSENAELVALCDQRQELAREMASRYHVNAVYGSHKELLANENIDAIVVTTPPDSHFEILKAASESKKHVFVEKPLTMTLEECRKAIEICKINRVKLMVGFMRRFDKAFIWSKGKINSGDLGKNIVLNSTYNIVSLYSDYLKKTDADIVGKGSPSPGYKENMHFFILNQLVHHADIIRWIGGPIDRLLATSSFNDNNFTINAILKFSDKAVGCIQFNGLVKTDWQETLVIHGDKGSLYLKMFFPYLDTPTDTMFVSHQLNSRSSPLNVVNTMYEDELRYFLNCIVKDEEPEPNGSQALEAQEIISAIEKSLEHETWVDLEQGR